MDSIGRSLTVLGFSHAHSGGQSLVGDVLGRVPPVSIILTASSSQRVGNVGKRLLQKSGIAGWRHFGSSC